MKLLKIEDGKIDGNFYLTSDFTDFLGSANVKRDTVNNTVSLISNTNIERKFNFDEFVIEIKKQNWGEYEDNDFNECYVGTDNGIYGIIDDKDGEESYWKLLVQEGYIQVYSSDDGISWTNCNGVKLPDKITRQGFKKQGAKDFVLQDYNVYKNPYVTIFNFPKGTTAVLQDKDGNEIKREIFDDSMQVQIYLDSCMQGKLSFLDSSKVVIYTTDIINLQYGDVYCFSKYDLEVIYKGKVVSNPEMLDSLYEKISITNIGSSAYSDIKVGIDNYGNDLIQLSLDKAIFLDTITINNIQPNESIDIYIKITKLIDNYNYTARNFQLIIE
ncbi:MULTISPECIES: hypothetical protein [Clostridium]|uniref:hypothetical protein n=1 Tax=Clostridium TaxID=1485 RepID=UPI0008268019|nr:MULTISPECIES: hypothetical protein [Clostridium]PJI07031.1 hypothetical protein CUB90_03760 [Clostridium sp. CT7]